MTSFEEVNSAREKLMQALGEKSKQYMQHMKLWFQMKSTKEDFDLEARKLLDPSQTHLHNQFLLQLFLKCAKQDLPTSSPSPNQRSKTRRRARQNNGGFQPSNVHDYVQPRAYSTRGQKEPPRYCTQELLLPDCELIHMRLMLAAWELGLKGAEQSAADLLVIAVQHFLKNILNAVLSRRSGFRVREGRVQYAVGLPVPSPWLRCSAELLANKTNGSMLELTDAGDSVPAVRPSVGETQQDIALSYAASASCPNKTLITPMECFEALQIHRSAVPSHGVYSINMERILSQTHHPSWDDVGE